MPIRHNRRTFLKTTASIGGVSLLAGCLGDDDDGDDDMIDLEFLMVDGAADIPIFMGGLDDGIWEDHGIDLTYNVTGYGEYARSLTADGPSNIGSLTINMLVDYWEQGDEVVYFGPNMQQVQSILVRPDSGIETPADLEGKHIGTPTLASAAPIVMGAMIEDEYGVDIREDAELTESDPPVLWNLFMNQGEFDAILQFTGFTIAAHVTDGVDVLFQANEFWEQKTGFPSMVLNFTAKKDYAEENPGDLLTFLDAWNDAVDNFLDDPEPHLDSYGAFSGLDTPAKTQQATDMWQNGDMHYPVDGWDQEFIDEQWVVKELMQETGFTDSVPPIDEAAVSLEELEERAE